MNKSERSFHWFVSIAGIILLICAAFHATGYIPLAQQLAASNMQSSWLAGVKGLWLIYSFHVAILGMLFIVASARSGHASRTVLFISGLIPAADTIMLLIFVGVFIGTILLGLATVLFFVGLVLRPSPVG